MKLYLCCVCHDREVTNSDTLSELGAAVCALDISEDDAVSSPTLT